MIGPHQTYGNYCMDLTLGPFGRGRTTTFFSTAFWTPTFYDFWEIFTDLGPKWVPFSRRIGIHFETLFGPKSRTISKSGCPESSREKSRHRTSPGVARCGIHTVITICLERSNHARSGGFWVTFGYPLGSLLATLGSKWPVLGAKKRPKKSYKKQVRKVARALARSTKQAENSSETWRALHESGREFIRNVEGPTRKNA